VLVLCIIRRFHQAELLLQFGAMPDAPDRRGVTPLIAAAANNHSAVVFKLLEKLKGSAVPVAHLPRVLDCAYKTPLRTDLTGRSALLAAAATLAPRCVQLLLAAGCDSEARDACGQTLLHLAAAAAATQAQVARRRAAHAARADSAATAAWEKAQGAEKLAKPKFGAKLGSPKSRGSQSLSRGGSGSSGGGGGNQRGGGSRGGGGGSSPLGARGSPAGSRGLSSRGSFSAEPPRGPPVTQVCVRARREGKAAKGTLT
jgi:uncharacterized membrane protein YgcG